jgi:hypothetical protein
LNLFGEFAEAGGLMNYGPSIAESYRQAGIYAGQVREARRPAGFDADKI